MAMEIKSKLPFLVCITVFLTEAALLLTACLTQAATSVTPEVMATGTSTWLPPRTSESTQEPDTPTPLPRPTKPLSATPIPIPTIVPTLPACPGGALLFTHSYGQNEKGQTLHEVRWVCSGSGTSYTQLVASGIAAINMSVSPNGDRVAFGGEVLQVMDLASREVVTFVGAVQKEQISYPSWSPDGEYIVYERWRATHDYSPIEVLHLASGTVSDRFIPSEYEDQIVNATVSGIVWLPHEDQVLLYGNYTQDLYLLDVACDATSYLCAAGSMRKIPTDRGIKESPAVSPDGTRIAALCIVPESYPVDITLCILDFTGRITLELNLEDLGLDYVYNLAWSPDGTRIAFDTVGSIFILSLSDQSVTKLDVIGSQPVWLP